MRGGRWLRGLGAEAGTGVTRYGEYSAWAKRDQKEVRFPTLGESGGGGRTVSLLLLVNITVSDVSLYRR